KQNFGSHAINPKIGSHATSAFMPQPKFGFHATKIGFHATSKKISWLSSHQKPGLVPQNLAFMPKQHFLTKEFHKMISF
ncbi:hypothetical protein HGI15_22310, partial [Modestobacter lapidis]|nr:hypothetical protein [Modestobacter lapidis]